jgi:hypothetical protein
MSSLQQTLYGDSNVLAGQNVYIQRTEDALDKFKNLAEFFERADANFLKIINDPEIVRGDKKEPYSSELLFSSLVRIGLPASIAIDVPNLIIPLLKAEFEQQDQVRNLSANDIKSAVLRVLTGLQFQPPYSQDEVQTWCTAYVRRYGNSTEFVQVIDHGIERELNFEFLTEEFIPHIIEHILGVEKGFDAVRIYNLAFPRNTIKRIAGEIIKIANSINVYSIQYKTLFFVVKDIMLQPPHPWIVNNETKDAVFLYNLNKLDFHWSIIGHRSDDAALQHVFPSAWECAAHASALLLTHYGTLLGVESRYGLSELIRICHVKIKNNNIVFWDFCSFNQLDDDLARVGMSVKSFTLFLERVHSHLIVGPQSDEKCVDAFAACGRLVDIVKKIVGVT